MNAVQILMPMGGLGSRFATSGYVKPKPLILVDNKPMFLKSLDSYSNLENCTNIFVVRQEHVNKFHIDRMILDLIPRAKIVILRGNTKGAVETCLLAKDLVDDSLPLVIADCDIYFKSADYYRKIISNKYEGLLLTFRSNDPRYSYAKTQNDKVISTAEKRVISRKAILGSYYFKTGGLFKELAEEFVSEELPRNLNEYYVSHLFNIMIKKGCHVSFAKTDEMFIFGTPEELTAYERRKTVDV